MKITSIKAQIKNQERVSIYIDGKYDFSLDQGQLLSARLFTGKEITEKELQVLKDESAFGKALGRALDYIMRRPRSVKELRDYAWRKQWEPEMRDRVIARLQEKGYLDDVKFAEIWVRHRGLGKPISARKLRLELKQKGITDDVADAALAVGNEFNEQGALRQLIAKKRARYEDERKFIAYLMRQGFRYDDIRSGLEASEDGET